MSNEYTGQWATASSESCERWDGPYDSRQEAIEEMRGSGFEEFTIAPCHYPDPASFIDASDIIDQIENCGDECWIDESPWEFSADAKSSLTQMLKEWAEKHVTCTSFRVEVSQAETIDAAGPIGCGK
jgi:hypothetical protein